MLCFCVSYSVVFQADLSSLYRRYFSFFSLYFLLPSLTIRAFLMPCMVRFFAVCALHRLVFALSCIMLLSAFTASCFPRAYICLISIALTVKALIYSALWGVSFWSKSSAFDAHFVYNAFIRFFEIFHGYYD